jgi:hypothetical protein
MIVHYRGLRKEIENPKCEYYELTRRILEKAKELYDLHCPVVLQRQCSFEDGVTSRLCPLLAQAADGWIAAAAENSL